MTIDEGQSKVQHVVGEPSQADATCGDSSQSEMTAMVVVNSEECILESTVAIDTLCTSADVTQVEPVSTGTSEGMYGSAVPSDPTPTIAAADPSGSAEVKTDVPMNDEACAIEESQPDLEKNTEESQPDLEKKTEESQRLSGGGECSTGPTTTTTAISSSASSATPVSMTDAADQIHQVKWICWNETKTPIITQNENGPCPLLAIINVLLLRGQAQVSDYQDVITGQQLLQIVGDCILRLSCQKVPETHRGDHERNVSDAIGMLAKLLTGIDVNVRFTGVHDFEYTNECIVFDLLSINLYHGWLVDPAEQALWAEALGSLSYNSVLDKIVACKHTPQQNEAALSQAVLAEQFLEQTANQLTYHGLMQLNTTLRDNELAVVFRNNHFSVLHKHRDELFTLVTDAGFMSTPNVVWETLASVDGDCHFVDAAFHNVPMEQQSSQLPPPPALPSDASPEQQIDHDYQLALSMSRDDGLVTAAPQPTPDVDRDAALAMQLQREEEQAVAAEERARQPTNTGSAQQVANDRRTTTTTTTDSTAEKSKNCEIM